MNIMNPHPAKNYEGRNNRVERLEVKDLCRTFSETTNTNNESHVNSQNSWPVEERNFVRGLYSRAIDVKQHLNVNYTNHRKEIMVGYLKWAFQLMNF